MKKIPGFGEFKVTKNGDVYSPKGEKLRKFNVDGFLAVEIEGEDYHIKDLVYHTYVERLKQGHEVILRDNDMNNNNVNNLQCFNENQKIVYDVARERAKRRDMNTQKAIAGLPEHLEQSIEESRLAATGSFKDRMNAELKARVKGHERKNLPGRNCFGDKVILGLEDDTNFVNKPILGLD